MTNHAKLIPAGHFKGKKITLAETYRDDENREIASEFMAAIFDLLPTDYAISDESELRDFTAFGSKDTSREWRQIEDHYGITLSTVETENLAAIFATIAHRRNAQ